MQLIMVSTALIHNFCANSLLICYILHQELLYDIHYSTIIFSVVFLKSYVACVGEILENLNYS